MKKRQRNRLVITLILILGAGAALAWLIIGHNEASQVSVQKIVRAVRRDISSTVLATGAVNPQVGAEVKVGARISGKVEHLYANIGDPVKKGQIVAELEKADLKAAVAKAKAEVKVAQARITEAAARLKLAELEWQRQQNLIKKDFTSQQALDKALQEKESAQAGLNLVKKQLDAAKAAWDETRVKLSYATITAPISGVIASVSTQQGETVSAGLNAPTFVTIIDLNRIQVDAFVDETDIGRVKAGQKAVFTVDTYPDKDFAGVVTAIYPKAIIQDNVVNYDVVISINSPFKKLLRPDMTASVTIYQKERKGVLMVPRKAIIREGGGKFILVREADGPPRKQAVRTGANSGRYIEIVSGINEGDMVVIEK